eukprot:c20546_g1_i1 orf=152-946(+)
MLFFGYKKGVVKQTAAALLLSTHFSNTTTTTTTTPTTSSRAMAALRSSSNVALGVLAVVAVILVSTALPIGEGATCSDNLVYPFSARCDSPARYYGVEVYELGAYLVEGSLAPEWDETNSTYYVRLADSGAKYKFMHRTREYRFAVSQSDDVIIVNTETGRALGWRKEGEDEYFLIETEEDVAILQFAAYDGAVACPLIYPPLSCGVYNLVNYGTSVLGLSPYLEDEVTYFKLSSSSEALTGFILRTSSSSDDDVKLKMATAAN